MIARVGLSATLPLSRGSESGRTLSHGACSSSGASVVSGLTQSLAYPQEREQTAGIPAGGNADYATISPGDSSQPTWMFIKVDEPGAGGNSFHPTEAARRLASAPWAHGARQTRSGWCPVRCPG